MSYLKPVDSVIQLSASFFTNNPSLISHSLGYFADYNIIK